MSVNNRLCLTQKKLKQLYSKRFLAGKSFKSLRLSKMAVNVQYIREYIDINQLHQIENLEQLCQIKKNGVFSAELYKVDQRIIVDDVVHGDVFFLRSPDLPDMTIRDVLIAIGYRNYQIEDFWAVNNEHQNNVLDTPVLNAPLYQISIRTINNPNVD